MEDSDEEDMKRIISKTHNKEDSDEEMKSDAEEGESEMEDDE